LQGEGGFNQLENCRDMNGIAACVVGFAPLLASALIAASGPSTSTSMTGTLQSVGESANGPVITIAQSSGTPASIAVAAKAIVRERAAGGVWQTVSIAALKVGEPLTVRVDRSGAAAAIDAEYALVDSRSVVLQNGYLIGSDGVARKLVGDAARVPSIPLGAYLEMRTDPATGDVFDLAISLHPFASSAAHAVAVTIEVLVPLNTPPGSTVYLATNAQSWTPNAVLMSPLPGNKWVVTMQLPAGSVLQYKYTRGSWASGERDASGAEIPDRTLSVVTGKNTQSVDDVVARWADLPS
jgi:hypothetical protein